MNFHFHWNPDNLLPFLMVLGIGIALTVSCNHGWWFAL